MFTDRGVKPDLKRRSEAPIGFSMRTAAAQGRESRRFAVMKIATPIFEKGPRLLACSR